MLIMIGNSNTMTHRKDSPYRPLYEVIVKEGTVIKDIPL